MPLNQLNHIDGVMVSVLVLSTVDCGFESGSGQTKDYEIRLFRIISIPTMFRLFRVLTSELLGRRLPVFTLLL
jgi:hypothetical protein